MKACVIGVGAMGRHHARVLSTLEKVELVGLVDQNIEAADRLARRFNTLAFPDLAALIRHSRPDFAIVAVPTTAHFKVATALIEEGIAVLIEKPISSTLEEADQLIALASQKKVMLSVGHIERFNPAVMQLKARLLEGEAGTIHCIETCRRGPFPKHVLDVGVALDLAVHDVDLIRHISGEEIMEEQHIAERRIHRKHEDFLRAQMRLSGGTLATLAIDWLTPTKIRELYASGDKGMFRVDLLTQDLFFYENLSVETSGWDTIQELRGVSEGRIVRHVVNKAEPLLQEIMAFINSLEKGIDPVVSGADAKRALELAQQFALKAA